MAHVIRSTGPLLLLSLFMAAAAGCSSSDRIAAENDRLRRRVMEMERSVADVTRRNEELAAELRALSMAPDQVPPSVREATPHVASLAVGRLSHARDDDGDGITDRLLLYVETSDGLGRPLQIVGTMSVHAALLPADGDATTIARAHLEPVALRETYRSGFGGSHYTIAIPVDEARIATVEQSAARDESCIVRVVFEDGRTGRRLEAERPISLRPTTSRVAGR